MSQISSAVDICNLALSHIGVGKPIANLETESSEEAATLRLFYDVVRDEVLRDFPWPFATRTAALALVEEDPTDEWDYSYRYPADALMLRRILSGIRNDTIETRVPYRVASDSGGRLIYTDQEDAEIEYTVKSTNIAIYPSDFIMAFSFRLAASIAPRLSAGDPFKLGAQALQLYSYEISKAAASSANEEVPDLKNESEFIRSRE